MHTHARGTCSTASRRYLVALSVEISFELNSPICWGRCRCYCSCSTLILHFHCLLRAACVAHYIILQYRATILELYTLDLCDGRREKTVEHKCVCSLGIKCHTPSKNESKFFKCSDSTLALFACLYQMGTWSYCRCLDSIGRSASGQVKCLTPILVRRIVSSGPMRKTNT